MGGGEWEISVLTKKMAELVIRSLQSCISQLGNDENFLELSIHISSLLFPVASVLEPETCLYISLVKSNPNKFVAMTVVYIYCIHGKSQLQWSVHTDSYMIIKNLITHVHVCAHIHAHK